MKANHTTSLNTLPLPVLELVPASLQPDPRAHLAAVTTLIASCSLSGDRPETATLVRRSDWLRGAA